LTQEVVNLKLIDDNPYQPRSYYPPQRVSEVAYSIEQIGLLHVPKARRSNGRYQLAEGHIRKRAFLKLQKKNPKKWETMPLEVEEIPDDQMGIIALEENMRRTDLTPLDIARAIDKYLTSFTSVTETALATKMNMTQGNISNMRRVLRCPQKVLDRILEGRINFTMARELLIFQGLKSNKSHYGELDEEGLMTKAIRLIRTESGHESYGSQPATVEGIKRAIDSTASDCFRHLEKGYGYYNDVEPLFDTRLAGCLKCEKMIRTFQTKTQARHFCTDPSCWDKKQKDHKDKQAAEARKRMQAEIAARVAEEEKSKAEAARAMITSTEFQETATEPEAAATEQTLVEETAKEQGKRKGKVPAEILAAAKEKSGTRAEVLDLRDLKGSYYGDLKQGYVQLDGGGYQDVLKIILDPDECLKRCTKGFHFAFDSSRQETRTYAICSDTKCLAQKKAAFTRAKNAEGKARKAAEVSAVKEAVEQTKTLDHARIKLIFLGQLEGIHSDHYGYGYKGKKSVIDWLWDKLSPGITKDLRTDDRHQHHYEKLFKEMDKRTLEELSKLVVEFMLYYLADQEDLERYEIKCRVPLGWLGIKVEAEDKKQPVPPGAEDDEDEEDEDPED